MVTAQQTEKKIPMTLVGHKIGERTYQYLIEADSPLDDCLAALEEIRDFIQKYKEKVESQKQEPPAQG